MTNKKDIKVAFVCTGNICRSPMAEAVFAKIVKDKNLNDQITLIDSFGTHAYHVGEDPDYRTLKTCRAHKVPINHRAQQIKPAHFDKFDYVICMDDYNLSSLKAKQPRGSKAIVNLFGHWKEDSKFDTIVDDPYYGNSDGFEVCYEQCVHFSEVFLKRELGV
ncbi:hypothetical protein CANARDRAFT_27435 [[Candida] arabinofermentans NRRL YB-2248]|uniref:Phosphotyrosine protein phosphatase I domain-containing protein n=1 Tax=[Candida] arabinofermentans NRRL YB-2248 TaxID=983967 RepID=A0A1E4T371_9ASCO|nr:hypothetical protein CANARDRAFT_27435 [[Candida] arabinofermentans NRRL YB-2248]